MRIRLCLLLAVSLVDAQNLANGLLVDAGSNAGFVSRINQKVSMKDCYKIGRRFFKF
ncbi:hypothetical protein KIN20_028917 [Parelaphostrongylus tenuis]|uniref:Uncharacterized protein n=1 Tax=Parelaphostrongylus tenuis TaxID=148309 RepID=A0AAD5WF32_PARTN|nr:hypothetical protein KIN20_028917 [Parelaphostrongylus tenuis]